MNSQGQPCLTELSPQHAVQHRDTMSRLVRALRAWRFVFLILSPWRSSMQLRQKSKRNNEDRPGFEPGTLGSAIPHSTTELPIPLGETLWRCKFKKLWCANEGIAGHVDVITARQPRSLKSHACHDALDLGRDAGPTFLPGGLRQAARGGANVRDVRRLPDGRSDVCQRATACKCGTGPKRSINVH